MRWVYGGIGALSVIAFACSSSETNDAHTTAPGEDASAPIVDAGSLDAAPDVFDAGPPTIHVHAKSPTWAVKLDQDTKTWKPFDEGDSGIDGGTDAGLPSEYVFTTTDPSYSVAFACADSQSSLVTVFTRSSDVTDLTVDLGPMCAPPIGDTTNLTGNFLSYPNAAGWLDFGYADDWRSFIQPTADYELDNLIAGTFDLAFGLRAQFGDPLLTMVIARDVALTKTAATLDVDVAKGFVPTNAKLSLSNLNNEQTHVSLMYAFAGSQTGIELGPANDPDGKAAADVDVPIVPGAQQRATDLYRVNLLTVTDKNNGRGAKGSFHATGSALAIDLPDAIDPPTATTANKLVSTKTKSRAGAAFYDASVFTQVTGKSTREWRVSISASLITGSDVDLTPPDFSSVAGFDATWLTPSLSSTVTARIHDPSTPLGDGTIDRFAQRSIPFDPQ
jgi:hypothetical protein